MKKTAVAQAAAYLVHLVFMRFDVERQLERAAREYMKQHPALPQR